ncbi:TetR/AcrR family transcriptional regulator [Peribacillus simplex]|uniref:TetR/AcrR family transcriptional regulator n=2 Tax=Peribacillus TaxID=2675229 RepID=A0AA90SLT2_9BACI|nr:MULTISPECIES: TetR/AcrR family transcriptional regulator [Peribacillus]MDP1420625.1 TetR/AcrR family transcriptional regulator [Peribacillus simplex]MDP1453536.1 TetR/AcrR family transcriptional regulator [Peribacillus frigoritolerans]
MARNKEFDEKQALRKAMELFWQQGYEKTSMQELVDYMGIHRRSIYDTFGDKRTLFLSALSHYEELITTEMKKRVDSNLLVKQAIREVFKMVIYPGLNLPKGCLSVNAAVELSLLDEEIATKIAGMFKKTESLFYELLKHGQKNGEISRRHDPEVLSLFLHNSLVGLRVLVKTEDDNKKLESIVDMTLSVLE